METLGKFANGIIGGGMVSGLFLFIFKNQNKRIAAQDEKIKVVAEKKTDRGYCKIIHKNLEETTAEIKKDIKDIHIALTANQVTLGQIKTMLTGGIEKDKG